MMRYSVCHQCGVDSIVNSDVYEEVFYSVGDVCFEFRANRCSCFFVLCDSFMEFSQEESYFFQERSCYGEGESIFCEKVDKSGA